MKYKLYNDSNSFNIEFTAKATLKEYRQDKTGFTFSIIEVL